jgi:SulP family sulfate permease
MGGWLPKSVLCLKSYTKRMFVADLLAGITVGLVALPLAMASAVRSSSHSAGGLLRHGRMARDSRAFEALPV